MKTGTALLALSLLLYGCFSNDEEKTPQLSKEPPFAGVVTLEEVRGADYQAGISAAFFRSEQVMRRASQECRFSKTPSHPPTQPNEYISVGALNFGPAFQTSLVTVEKGENRVYRKKIGVGLPAGLYQVAAEGEGDVTKFYETLSLPEEWKDATINGFVFEEGIRLQSGEAARLHWSAPVLPNDANFILIEFIVDDGSERSRLQCVTRENALPVAGSWEIPAEEMEKLPPTKISALYLLRAHVRAGSRPEWNLELQGIRTLVGLFSIQ